jgi:hypothetical protein
MLARLDCLVPFNLGIVHGALEAGDLGALVGNYVLEVAELIAQLGDDSDVV